MKRKDILWIRLLVWTGIMFYLCTMPNPKEEVLVPIPYLDKIAHFVIFFFFSIFGLSWLQENRFFTSSKNIICILLMTAAYGALIEWLQDTYFDRSAEWWDWKADVLGGIAGILLYPLLHSRRLAITKLVFKSRK